MAERWRTFGVLAVAALAVVTGCANVPTSGELEIGDAGQRDLEPPVPHVGVPGPKPGATAEEIVAAFPEAMLTYEGGSTKAKEFLTDEAATSWDTSTVQISKYRVTTTGNGLTLKYTLTGKVVDGVYTSVPEKDVTYPLTLARVDGEFRITNPPDGMIMTEENFEREFSRYYRYFWDPSFTYLVPDPLYLPNGNPKKVPTLLASALLDGPTETLEPAVRSAFPEGTTLNANTVPVIETTAEVDLSEEAAQATQEQREQMAAQLAWTLTEVASVVDVEPRVVGSLLYTEQPVTRTEFSSLNAAELTRSPDSLLYGVADSGLTSLNSDGEQVAVGGPLGATPGLGDVAVNPRAEQAVAVNQPGGPNLLMADLEAGAELHTIYSGTSMSSLAWDPTGVIWGIDTDADGSHAIAVTPDGEGVPVEIPGLDGRDVTALSISPDGTRLAVVLDDVAEIRTIVRANGVSGPIEAINPQVIKNKVLDVAWTDGTSIVMLVSSLDEPPRPYVAGLTRDEFPYEPVDGAVAVAAAAGQTGGGIVVAADDGSLHAVAADGTSEPLPAMRAPAYPG